MPASEPINIFNKPEYKQRRQELRHNMTEAEKCLWQIVRNKQMGIKFRRQHGIAHYIVDFYCSELKLIIEVDGDSHFSEDAQGYDKIRDAFMLSLGIVTIRLNNHDVMQNIDGVYQLIKSQIDLRIEYPLPASPLSVGGAKSPLSCEGEG